VGEGKNRAIVRLLPLTPVFDGKVEEARKKKRGKRKGASERFAGPPSSHLLRRHREKRGKRKKRGECIHPMSHRISERSRIALV